jgi:NAD(P)-dependent dehydrogenase (short-subunit alcohol dehydrogenase family)
LGARASSSSADDNEIEKRPKVALIVGAGSFIGRAIALRFAMQGHIVAVNRRARHSDKLNELAAEIEALGRRSIALPGDARVEDDVRSMIARCEELGELDVLVHNIGANVFAPIGETTSRVFDKVHELAARSAFLCAREASIAMARRQRGTILFTGASASVRGAAGFAAFGAAMAAKRSLAQSMARELGPRGIHVAHVVIDSPVDTQFVAELLPDYEQRKQSASLVQPGDVAREMIHLYEQPRTAWTHELDLRPWNERF